MEQMYVVLEAWAVATGRLARGRHRERRHPRCSPSDVGKQLPEYGCAIQRAVEVLGFQRYVAIALDEAVQVRLRNRRVVDHGLHLHAASLGARHLDRDDGLADG